MEETVMAEGEHPDQSEQRQAAIPQQQSATTAPALTPSAQPSLHELLRLVIVDPDLNPAQKKDLLDELRKSGGADRWTFRSAIWILGAVVLVTVVAVSVVTWALPDAGKIPDGLIAIGSGAAGGVGGLLTPGRERGASS
jgi:hypothetical protein